MPASASRQHAHRLVQRLVPGGPHLERLVLAEQRGMLSDTWQGLRAEFRFLIFSARHAAPASAAVLAAGHESTEGDDKREDVDRHDAKPLDQVAHLRHHASPPSS